MDKFLDLLNTLWDFINQSFWFPAIIAIICIVLFAFLFFKANRDVDKHRAAKQQKIVNDAYGEYIHQKYHHQQSPFKPDNQTKSQTSKLNSKELS